MIEIRNNFITITRSRWAEVVDEDFSSCSEYRMVDREKLISLIPDPIELPLLFYQLSFVRFHFQLPMHLSSVYGKPFGTSLIEKRYCNCNRKEWLNPASIMVNAIAIGTLMRRLIQNLIQNCQVNGLIIYMLNPLFSSTGRAMYK